MTAPYDGGCACAGVRYRLHSAPLTLYACHCTDCQKECGSAFALSMPVLRDAIELLAGEVVEYVFACEDGRRRRGRRCPTCGSRLWGEPERLPQIAVLRPGTLDDVSWLHPVGHIWLRSAQPWVAISDDTLRFDGQPDDDGALVRAWRARHG